MTSDSPRPGEAAQAELVVVTGGGTGLGRAIAGRAGHSGRRVLIVGRRLDKLLAVQAAHPDPIIEVCQADVATVHGAEQVRDAVADLGLPVHALVAAAGAATRSPGQDATLPEVDEAWTLAWRSNVMTAVLTVEALLAQSAPTLRVVLLGSIAVFRGGAGPYSAGPYAASKAALTSYMHELAARLGPQGGTANVVSPGFIPDTGLWDDRLTAEAVRTRVDQTLVGRAGTPEEIAGLVDFLSGPDGAWITGQVISPNGGAVLSR